MEVRTLNVLAGVAPELLDDLSTSLRAAQDDDRLRAVASATALGPQSLSVLHRFRQVRRRDALRARHVRDRARELQYAMERARG